MNLLLNLSGEHPELPKAEVYATLEGEGIQYKPIFEDKKKRTLILWVQTDQPKFINRLAMTKKVGEFIGSSESIDEIARALLGKISGDSFAVEGETQEIRETLGEAIWKLGYSVDLLTPGSRILCFEDAKGKYDIAIETPIERDFNERKPHKRPYVHPTSLNPKLARVLVNLSRVKEGDMILDPFCGTGGILIEAGLMGMQVMGCDISEEAMKGCMLNLKHYGITGLVEACDAMNLETINKEVDAIVTDLPYGRSSYVNRRGNMEEFYSSFLSSAVGLLKPGKHLVAVFPNTVNVPEPIGFKIRETYNVYVHKSLTRQIVVYRRI